jgi:integrase
LEYRPDGRRKRRIVYGETKKEAQEKLRKLQAEADAGTLADAGKLTVGEYLARWLETTARARVRPATFVRYRELVELHTTPHIGRVPLGKLTFSHVEDLYATLERNEVGLWTRRAVGMLLTNALRAAVKRKLIPFNPAADVTKARAEYREMKFLTDAESKRLLEAARPHRLYALFALALGSGMRQGEILGLQWGDIDFDKGTVSVVRSLSKVTGAFILKEPKSKHSRRTVTLPKFALDALHAHRARMLAEGNISAPVFCTSTGHFIYNTNLTRKVFRPMLKRAGLPAVRFHDLRHSHATNLLAKGFSIKAVSQRLGHAKVEITLAVYTHVLPTDDAVLADGLEKMLG